MAENPREFLEFSLAEGVLRFGQFTTKAGRNSPYFFNAGLFYGGRTLGRLGRFYAAALAESGIGFDILFGPAYKGIPLATATAIAWAHHHPEVAIAFDRKEVKDHGEGGSVIGAPLVGQRVMIIDDVISAGTSVRNSVRVITQAGGVPVGVVIALDRQERGAGPLGARQEVESELHLPVVAIANLEQLVELLAATPELAPHLSAIMEYRKLYGTSG